MVFSLLVGGATPGQVAERIQIDRPWIAGDE